VTREEFDRKRASMHCRYCGDPRLELVLDVPPPHAGAIKCGCCGRHIDWVAKDENADERPAIKASVRDDVWARYGNRCVHCGITAEHLDMLRFGRTVQHVPPWKVAGREAELLPYCEPCQADSAVKMRRTETLIARVLEIAKLAREQGRT